MNKLWLVPLFLMSSQANATKIIDLRGYLPAGQSLTGYSALQNDKNYIVTVKFSNPTSLEAQYRYAIEKYEFFFGFDGRFIDYSDDLGRYTVIPYKSVAPSKMHKFVFRTPVYVFDVANWTDASGVWQRWAYKHFDIYPENQAFKITVPASPEGTFFAISVTSPVPEPRAWAIMILGLGAIGLAIRRKQRANVHFVHWLRVTGRSAPADSVMRGVAGVPVAA
ncbi:PEPxxWA-CTERM sorting domain-containing protein [Novosphingobium sp.]|uniref:PEPxxWA-CTERM sorting domain-containing protein n=1 Tax=Novosphingobium sp. TaxID=1874826 RepID=UPI00262F3BF8|nr:PEPxxWA-CTERM sorting domain-containing protein [Novosphingobium sp.]